MHLEGQERGYAMAALLVMMSVMAILMTALLPVWKQQAQREKEAELAFRGEQYARAIYLFRTKNGNQPPPNLDVLVSGKYLRKRYKDPITGEDFLPIFGGQQPQQPGPQGRGGQPQGRGTGPTPTGVGSGQTGQGRGVGQTATGLVTVQSKSKDPSIRIYNNAAYYNLWQFFYNARGRGGPAGEGARPGAPGVGPGRGSPTPGRGGPGTGPGGRGTFPGGRAPIGRGPGRSG